ncbi:spore protease [Ruminococcus sp. YE71]|uniref:GPR endopeptidase n=1 Tax=unclassified Ruminococcus TaxID=2608920 RepID=UPI00087FD2D1|nr:MULTISPECIES: GPR endopeptidase [unclassified Ruminococcus]SDA18657.1 spore protease [Ruminococcus sp. YE78]SFW29524.1 spore protease [Ruminococcus sp. YE71]
MAIDTDLALEVFDSMEDGADELSGVRCGKYRDEDSGFEVTEIEVLTEAAAERLGKPAGRYITLEADAPLYEWSPKFEGQCRAVSQALEKVCGGRGETLFFGLGNRRITPDCVGALTADRVFATRHIKRLAKGLDTDELGDSAVVAAGVLAQTGIESAELAAALCRRLKPAQVIVCDALACSEPSHMGRTIQLCSTGISPGSGVDNSRAELSERTLGVPCAAIGVPTVSRIMSGDERFEGLLVTPKPVDRLVLRAAEIIAAAVNLYLHPTLTYEDINSLIL